MKDGFVELPRGPGLGVEIDPEGLEAATHRGPWRSKLENLRLPLLFFLPLTLPLLFFPPPLLLYPLLFFPPPLLLCPLLFFPPLTLLFGAGVSFGCAATQRTAPSRIFRIGEMTDAEKTTDAVAILHRHYVEGKPESVMVAGL